MIEIQNTPLTPQRPFHSSVKPLDLPPMSSYRYPPEHPEVQGSLPQHQQYPPAQYNFGGEPYRAQPVTIAPTSTSTAPLNLPPLRSIDPRQHQQQHAFNPAPGPAPAPYGGAPIGGGYPTMPGQMSAMTSGQPSYYPAHMAHPGAYDPTGYNPNMMRYPLPMGDASRALPGGRHKKEVKRRTKTGCLTCRKRRIKCDEGQPTCRNCQKSKRECAGYDPIFKAQQTAAPVPPSSSVSSQSSSTVASHALVGQNYPPYSQGQSTIINSPGLPFDRPRSAPTIARFDPEAPSIPPGASTDVPIQERSKISEFQSINGYEPPPLPKPEPIDYQLHTRLLEVWNDTYSPGFNRLLDTMWFNTPQASGAIFGGSSGIEDDLRWEFANFILNASDTNYLNDPTIPSQEARLVWRLLNTCHRFSGVTGSVEPAGKDNPMVVSGRLAVIEALLTGDYLQANPLSPSTAYNTTNMHQLPVERQLLEQELEFWYNLGQCVTATANNETAAISSPDRGECLVRMRNVLYGYENRDILYSIAMCRHIGDQYPGNVISSQADRESYFVAKGFIESEITRGSTQIFQVLCRMAVRIWED